MPKAKAIKKAAQGNKKQNMPASGDAETLLKADHRTVEQLFQQFENATDDSAKEDLVRKACGELVVHTLLEEELFYPACRDKGVDSELLDEAQVEHDGVKVMIADLMDAFPDEQYYDAKVKTLSEYVKHHVGEEEKQGTGIFAKAREGGVDMEGLGTRIQARKSELMARLQSLTSRPPKPRALHINLQSQENDRMSRYSNERDRDDRGRFASDDDEGRGRSYSSRGRDRDDQGRFMSDDEGRSSRGGGRGHGGWFGDSEGHSQASREGWDERGSSRSSRSRYDDDDYERRGSSGGGRGHGGWFGDSEGHSQASREGWRHSGHEGSGWYGDPEGHSQASREGWRHSSHEGSGWYGDPEGHSEASREGWDDRGRSRSSRSRSDDDDDDRRGSRGGRGHGGWSGDPRGHSEASRRGWENR